MSAHIDGGVALGDFRLDVELGVVDGEVLAVLGPNGSGKTTLLRVLAGLERVDRGVVTIGGRTVDGPSGFVPPESRRVGYVPQGYGLFAHRSVIDNVAFGLRARGSGRRAARSRAGAMLDALGVGELAGRRPRELSGGQAQRVALARALAVEPDVVLLDEPLAALDVATRRAVRRELRRALSVVDGARLIVTHDPLDVYAVADRVAVLGHGRVVQTGTIAEVTARPRSAFVAQLVGTNLIDGTVHDGVLTTPSGAHVQVVTDVVGPAVAVVRPSSVTIGRTSPQSSVRNAFDAVVDDLVPLDGRVRVGLTGVVDLIAEITVGARDALDLRPGDRVVASVKATDIEVTER